MSWLASSRTTPAFRLISCLSASPCSMISQLSPRDPWSALAQGAMGMPEVGSSAAHGNPPRRHPTTADGASAGPSSRPRKRRKKSSTKKSSGAGAGVTLPVLSRRASFGPWRCEGFIPSSDVYSVSKSAPGLRALAPTGRAWAYSWMSYLEARLLPIQGGVAAVQLDCTTCERAGARCLTTPGMIGGRQLSSVRIFFVVALDSRY